MSHFQHNDFIFLDYSYFAQEYFKMVIDYTMFSQKSLIQLEAFKDDIHLMAD